MKSKNLKKTGYIICLLFFSFFMTNYAESPEKGILEYSVMEIDALNWIVTAKEVASGNIVKFRLPPSSFHGKTFDADLGKIKQGQPFLIKSPKHVRLERVQLVENPDLKKQKLGMKKGYVKRERAFANQPLPEPPPPQNWEILNISPSDWLVTAKHRQTSEIIIFKADPNGFRDFKFKSNIANIRQGEGLTLITSDDREFRNSLKLMKRSGLNRRKPEIRKRAK